MLNDFGEKVRLLRENSGITRETFCDDETELSVRQLARIENGESIPNLTKAQFIAHQLGVPLNYLTNNESLELSRRYEELKYLILRTPTYRDKERLAIRAAYFDEIYQFFYDDLPEEEQVVVDCMKARTEVFLTDDITTALPLIDEYFEQVKQRKRYTVNDLIIIDLYVVCLAASQFKNTIYNQEDYLKLTQILFYQEKYFSMKDIFVLSNLLFYNISLLLDLKMWGELEQTFAALKGIMAKTQDYHKKPAISMLEWKYVLARFEDVEKAKVYYDEAIVFAQLMGDDVLVENLKKEWKSNTT